MGWSNRSAEEWGEDLEDKPVKTIFKWIVIGFCTIVVLLVAVWGLGVAFSWWQGQGDAYQQKNSSQNWTSAQHSFLQQYNTEKQYVSEIAQARKKLNDWEKANPEPQGDPAAQTIWSQQEQGYQTPIDGFQQECQTTVTNYNTDSQSYLTEDWKSANLPPTLSLSDCN